jgi:hypothetical protein
MDPKRKFIVIVTLVYTVAAVAALGFISDWFREQLMLGKSTIVTTLVASLPAVLLLAFIAYWKFYDQRLAVLLVAVMLGSGGFVAKTYHDAYGEWLPSPTAADVENSGTAKLIVNGQTLSYRLELHNPGTLTHREYLVVSRGGHERRIRLPLFDDARSGYVSAKTPSDWIVLHPTDDADIYRADTGRFLFVHKSFRVNVQTGKVTSLSNG